jgi:alpha-beta hydrolase superfamily lysophospholipase
MAEKKAKGKFRSFLPWIIGVIITQLVLINISASIYAYRLTHFYKADTISSGYASANILQKTWKLFTGPKLTKYVLNTTPAFPYDTVNFVVRGNIPIESWYSKTDSVAKGTVILVHGVMINKGIVLTEAEQFRLMGYNVMLLDLRGHGHSGGNSTTMGVKETEEVKKAYDYIQSKGEKNIFLWGMSMGAVTVAKFIYDYNLPVSGIILEMPFASLSAYLRAKARSLNFPEQPFAFLVTFWMGLENGYNGFNHSTTRYAKKINCPVLLQWGTLDEFVLKSEITSIYDAIGSMHKSFVVYENARHESLLKNDPEKWNKSVGSFLSAGVK